MKKLSHKQMVKVLSEKLTKEELFQLFCLIDGDGPAGPFWEGLAEKSEEYFPEQFSLKTVSHKE